MIDNLFLIKLYIDYQALKLILLKKIEVLIQVVK
jgi:hypothetical protein